MKVFPFRQPHQDQRGLLTAGIILLVVLISNVQSSPTMNLGSLWFHHNYIEPWNNKDFAYNPDGNSNNRWYTTAPKVYELEGNDDGNCSCHLVFETFP